LLKNPRELIHTRNLDLANDRVFLHDRPIRQHRKERKNSEKGHLLGKGDHSEAMDYFHRSVIVNKRRLRHERPQKKNTVSQIYREKRERGPRPPLRNYSLKTKDHGLFHALTHETNILLGSENPSQAEAASPAPPTTRSRSIVIGPETEASPWNAATCTSFVKPPTLSNTKKMTTLQRSFQISKTLEI